MSVKETVFGALFGLEKTSYNTVFLRRNIILTENIVSVGLLTVPNFFASFLAIITIIVVAIVVQFLI